ncbi:MAG: hypothetical protein AAFO57_02175 [Pseudomonadota bacterium]
MLKMIVPALFLLVLAACGGGNGASDQNGDGSANSGSATTSKRLSGTLYFNSAEPLEAPQVMSMDLRRLSPVVAADGVYPSTWGRDLAYLSQCGPLSIKLSVVDVDGFTSDVSECYDLDVITPDVYAPAISPDGKYVSITNTALLAPKEPGDTYGLLRKTYGATLVFDRDGKKVAEFKGLGNGTWTRDNRLVMSGLNAETGWGIYKAKRNLKSVERIDDGRLNGPIWGMDAHPRRDRVAFIFNSALWEMDMGSGAPKRLHNHGYPLAAAAYSPGGDQIAFISTDTMEEGHQMPGGGYPIFIYDDGDIETIMVNFIVSGPLDWTD